MGLGRGLKAFEEAKAASAGFDGEKVEFKWLALTDGQKVKARFMNELDEDSPHYNAKFNTALVASEHTNPDDYKRKIVCTKEETGQCKGCEYYAAETPADREKREGKKSWRPKYRFYINLLIDDGKERYVAVWSQGLGKQSAFDLLRGYYGDTQGITNLWWTMIRNGTKTDTTYTLYPAGGPDTEPFDWGTFEAVPLDAVVRNVAYANQEKYLTGAGKVAAEGESASSNVSNSAWE